MIWSQTSLPARARKVAANMPWQRLALLAILALSTFLELFRITRESYSNTYYAATVKSMLTSWHNFFFASYDRGGFVTVDKPPLGFWIQAASAKLFGFHGWSLLLPQALAAVLSVALLYHLVRRTFGPVAGLLAALTLAVTPITVATARNNTVDCLLVLVVLVAAWAVIRATETGHLRWLVLGTFLVGIGFNIKMLQAYLVLPAFYLVYLLFAPRRWPTRLTHLALATVVLLGVSLSWALAVDLTPPDQRPYVGGSTNNTVIDLIIGYNGLARLTGGIGSVGQAPASGQPPQKALGDQQAKTWQPDKSSGDRHSGQDPHGRSSKGLSVERLAPPGLQGQRPGLAAAPEPQNLPNGQQAPSGHQQGQTPSGGRHSNSSGQPVGNNAATPRVASIGAENGPPGPLRFFNQQLAGQISWLLPLAGLGALVAGIRTLPPLPREAGHIRRMLAPLQRNYWAKSNPGAVRKHQALVLWGMWLLTQVVFFSVAGFWHTYYLVIVAPAIAALVGAGIVALWQEYRHQKALRTWRGWMLPTALVGMGVVQAEFLTDYPYWSRRLTPFIVGLCLVAAAGLVVARLWPRFGFGIRPRVMATVGVLALLIAPTTWSFITVWNAPGEMLPHAGPALREEMGAPGKDPGGAVNLLGERDQADPKLVDYLLKNRDDARFLVATESAGSASPIILSTGEPVMALGGFGADRIVTADQLADLVARGEVRFFLVSAQAKQVGFPGRTGDPRQYDLAGWVQDNCDPVPPKLWRSKSSDRLKASGSGFGGPMIQAGGVGEMLYDCGGKQRQLKTGER